MTFLMKQHRYYGHDNACIQPTSSFPLLVSLFCPSPLCCFLPDVWWEAVGSDVMAHAHLCGLVHIWGGQRLPLHLLSVSPSIHPFIHPYIHPHTIHTQASTIYISIYLSIYLFICLISVCQCLHILPSNDYIGMLNNSILGSSSHCSGCSSRVHVKVIYLAYWLWFMWSAAPQFQPCSSLWVLYIPPSPSSFYLTHTEHEWSSWCCDIKHPLLLSCSASQHFWCCAPVTCTHSSTMWVSSTTSSTVSLLRGRSCCGLNNQICTGQLK